MKIKRYVKIGDVLKIPIEINVFAIGQVVLLPDNDFEYIVVFDVFVSEDENIDFQNLTNVRILFVAQISGGINIPRREKKWKIIGSAPIRNDIVIPEYKVSTPNGWMVTNWKHQLVRPASNDEVAKLNFRTSYSLAAIENVLHDYWNSEPPNQYSQKLISSYHTRTE